MQFIDVTRYLTAEAPALAWRQHTDQRVGFSRLLCSFNRNSRDLSERQIIPFLKFELTSVGFNLKKGKPSWVVVSLFNREDEVKWGELLELSQKGNSQAYRELLNELYPVVKKYLHRRIHFFCDVEDATQEVLISFHNAAKTYDSSRPFGPWFFAVVKFKMVDIVRKQNRIKEKVLLESEQIEELSSAPSEDFDRKESLREVQSALSELPQKYRDAFVLLKVEGLSTSEAANKLSLSENNVRTRASRASGMIQKIIEKRLRAEI